MIAPRSQSHRSGRRDRQIVRVLAILRVLLDGGRPSVRDLAARFKTRRETIYRDFRTLQDVGYPLTGDDESGRLQGRPRLVLGLRTGSVPLSFTRQEVAALVWALKQTEARQPFRAALSTAMPKLQALVGREGHTALALDGAIGGWERGVKDYQGSTAIILRLVEAIINRRRCRIVEYRSPHREHPTQFLHDPYRLLYIHGALYSLGKASDHGHRAVVAVDRIRQLELTDEGFTVDPAIDAKRYEAEAFGVVWEKPMTVVVRFRPDQAPYVREREWHPTQRVRELPGGRVELTFRAGGTFEIARWVLGWGDAAEVVRPPALRREVATILQNAATIYRRASEHERGIRGR
jgi:predicted DNA-binding transcriptional regulator YafY